MQFIFSYFPNEKQTQTFLKDSRHFISIFILLQKHAINHLWSETTYLNFEVERVWFRLFFFFVSKYKSRYKLTQSFNSFSKQFYDQLQRQAKKEAKALDVETDKYSCKHQKLILITFCRWNWQFHQIFISLISAVNFLQLPFIGSLDSELLDSQAIL